MVIYLKTEKNYITDIRSIPYLGITVLTLLGMVFEQSENKNYGQKKYR